MNKKLFAVGGLALAGVGAVVGLTTFAVQSGFLGTPSPSPETITPTYNPYLSKQPPIMKEIKNGYKFNLEKKQNTLSDDQAQTTYVLKIKENNKPEGTIKLVNPSDQSLVDELEFAAGDVISVRIQMNEGYQDYTARELKLFNVKNPNVSLASKQDETDKTLFTIQTPDYASTLDPKTGESWLYNGAEISIVPTFIKASIGEGDNQVDWEHGAYQDSLNGYVFEMTEDIKWSEAKDQIYKTFENDDPTKPIDVYFYLNGHNLILDTDELNLDIPKGWGLNIFNNKYDTKTDESLPNAGAKYGEIKVEGENKTVPGKSFLKINGYLALGRSIKFNQYATTHGVVFYNPELLGDEKIAGMENDPYITLP